MRHLEPQQLARREEKPISRGHGSGWTLAAVMLAVAIAGGYGATRLMPPATADDVPSSEIKQRANDFAKAPRLQLAPVPAESVDEAISKMNLPPMERNALAAAVNPTSVTQSVASPQKPSPSAAGPQQAISPQPQRLGLVELILWDTHAPDGDVVLVASAGYSREVLLTKAPTVIHVPGTGTGFIQVTGLRDGGGGITLGIKGESASVLMPIMSVGQTLNLPVQFP